MNLMKGAALLGKKASFRQFLSRHLSRDVVTESDAANAVRECCQIRSRSELNASPAAAERYRALICAFNEWLNTEGLTR